MKTELRSEHLFNSVSRKCIEEGKEEDREEEDGNNLQDGELVVVPDDVPGHDGLHHLTILYICCGQRPETKFCLWTFRLSTKILPFSGGKI